MKSMKQKYRNGAFAEGEDTQERVLSLLYGTAAGRMLLKPLVHPAVSRMGGWVLSSSLSRILIRPFVRAHQIDLTQFTESEYPSYNAFFSRHIRPELRPVDMDPKHLISPCDSKLTVLPIAKDSRFRLKHTTYTLASLLRDQDLAERYAGGWALIFRLTVDDYHRYCYVADGKKTKNRFIPGVLHTVNPIANDVYPIYKENAREYSILRSKEFGAVTMMEVGALLVGKIVNHHGTAEVRRGQEKGFFQFGGSTVVLLLNKKGLQIDADILENSRQGIETVVKYGERIGKVE